MIANPTTEILNRIHAFCNDLSGAVSGDVSKTLAQQNRKLYAEWKKEIYSTAPDFRPFANQDSYSKPEWPNADPEAKCAEGIRALDLTQVREVINE
jgi:hypothetical protein